MKKTDSCRFRSIRILEEKSGMPVGFQSNVTIVDDPSHVGRKIVKIEPDVDAHGYVLPSWVTESGKIFDLDKGNEFIKASLAKSIEWLLSRELCHLLGVELSQDENALEQIINEYDAKPSSVIRERITTIFKHAGKMKLDDVERQRRIDLGTTAPRSMCDACMTGIWSSYWLATCCGTEICVTCMHTWKECIVQEGSEFDDDVNDTEHAWNENFELLKRCTYRRLHTPDHFVRAGTAGFLVREFFDDLLNAREYIRNKGLLQANEEKGKLLLYSLFNIC